MKKMITIFMIMFMPSVALSFPQKNEIVLHDYYAEVKINNQYDKIIYCKLLTKVEYYDNVILDEIIYTVVSPNKIGGARLRTRKKIKSIDVLSKCKFKEE